MEPVALASASENIATGGATASDTAKASASSPATVPQFLRLRASISPALPAQWSLDAQTGEWRSITWGDAEQRVIQLSAVLRAHGLAPGMRVGIIAPSSARWDCLQMAVFAARGIVVGLDPHDLDQRLSAIATDAGVSMLIAGTPELACKFSEAVRRNLRLVVLLDGSDAAMAPTACITWQQMLDAPIAGDDPWDLSRPDDTATIIFTSGTTGAPKGIAHTHHQLRVAANALLEAFADIREGSRLACWLPLSNLFQRMVNICAIGRGAQTWYVENPREIMQRVAEINPHIFIAVPRFYEKLHRGVMERIASAPRWKKAVANWALAVGAARAHARRPGESARAPASLRHRIADLLVLRQLKRVMGSNLLYMISGSAPMPPWLLERFDAMGLTILEAYGLSENTVPIAANRPDRHRFGSVGSVLAANELRFGDNGEILVRGEGLFSGYLGSTQADARFTADGFYRTGDLGHVDADGFLFISGRQSDAFKTSTGRWLAPAQIEAVYTAIPYVEQIVVIGRGRPFPAALLAVDARALASLLAGQGLRAAGGDVTVAQLASLPAARKRIEVDLERAGGGLAAHERIRRFELLPQALSFEADELTPSLKLKRDVIERKYASLIERIYADPA